MSRGGTCAGYYWVVEWKALGGDQPEMVIASSDLRGSDVHIHVATLVHGGTWFVLRGDWLRTPEEEPQASLGYRNLEVDQVLMVC